MTSDVPLADLSPAARQAVATIRLLGHLPRYRPPVLTRVVGELQRARQIRPAVAAYLARGEAARDHA